MLVSMVARSSMRDRHGVDRYASWRMALIRLQCDWTEGRRPEAAQLRRYLQDAPSELAPAVLEDLIALHLNLSWAIGRPRLLESYLGEFGHEFPDLSSPAVVPAELVEDEFLVRYLSPLGDAPDPDEYALRFSGRIDVGSLLDSRTLGGGRYIKLHRKGEGAAGEVWKGYDRRLRRPVAIKLPQADPSDSEALASFVQEIHDLAALQHPGIVPVHDFHEPEHGPPFYVMPLIQGKTLGELIRECHRGLEDRTDGEQRLLERNLLQEFATVCEAVAYAHARGVLHRDLTPANILLGEFCHAVIIDWQRQVAGTPEYMAPEQVDGRPDARSDVFGLGAVLYEILTGRPPHVWGNALRPADWPALVREATIPLPRRVRPDIPRALEAIAGKALARDPSERYSTAAELAQEMQRFLAGEPVLARLEPRLGWLLRRLRGER